MVAFNKTEWGISFITIDYYSILVISLIFLRNQEFLTEQDETEY
jgi:hypothetical protein